MPTITRVTMGITAMYEVWEDNFFLGSAKSYTEAEKIQEDFIIYKHEFLRKYQEGKVPVEYKINGNHRNV